MEKNNVTDLIRLTFIRMFKGLKIARKRIKMKKSIIGLFLILKYLD
jgi:hypothetical protein